MKVAIEGCLHGELQQVYDRLEKLQKKIKTKIELLLICGDFQSIRHEQDLEDMHCPEKYKKMGCFRDYYNGDKVAPILTVCIGGNHQAVNSFRESHFGGWIAKNIYFLGQVGSIIIRKGGQSLRITGLSGIYNAYDFKYRTLIERYPLRGKQKITAYHTKSIDIYRLELLGRICQMQALQPELYGKSNANFDIFLSHDWPKDIACYGNINQLLTIKPFLKKEIEQRTFGSAPLLRLLQIIQPNYWFSAHMHVKYPALFPHKNGRYTHFLSLDKCLGSRSCLQVLEFFKENQVIEQSDLELTIEVDPVWIGVLLLTEQLMEGKERFYHIEKQLAKIGDAQKMNALIGKYPNLISKIEEIGKFTFDPNLEQIDQTFSFFKAIGIPKEKISGICYPYQRPEIQMSKPEDEIQLDL